MHHHNDTPTAYPLSWPVGWKRSSPRSARFAPGMTMAKATARLQAELDRLGAAR